MKKIFRSDPSFIPFRRELRNDPTDAERFLWQHLRSHAIEETRFLRQYSIGNYIVDFYCPELKLAMELDGGQHSEQEGYDEARTVFLQAHGVKVLRFWNNELFTNIAGVLEVIRGEIILRTLSNSPLSQGGRIYMTPSEIKTIFACIGGGANKLLGQHFLIDDSVLNAIVETAEISKGDRVLEVGPGLGVLTRALLKRGADVVAIEKDQRFVEFLVGAHGDAPVRIVQGDAARMDWNKEIGHDAWKFVSNLPYSISSLALRKALWCPNPPKAVTVLVQKEVAQRAVDSRKTSLLSLMVALASREATMVQVVPQNAFFPAPKVESAILKIVPMPMKERMTRWGMDPEKIMELAKQGFSHPRKFLKSNLKNVLMHDHLLLEKIGISDKARAEELSPEDWAKLAKHVAASI